MFEAFKARLHKALGSRQILQRVYREDIVGANAGSSISEIASPSLTSSLVQQKAGVSGMSPCREAFYLT